ncbi:MAG: hypothetical protein WC499_01950 [Patescibacteria group bacterium]
MENKEKFKTPEIHSQELLKIIENVKWEEGEGIEYNGTTFLLFFSDETSESDGHQDAASYQSPSHITDFDIYLLKSLSIEDKKRRLFHEILEADLRKQGFNYNEAHDLTKVEEQKTFGK